MARSSPESVYSQLRSVYMKAFEDNVAMRQSLDTLHKAFEALVKSCGHGAAATAATAAAAPVIEQLKQQAARPSPDPQIFPAVLPATTNGTGAAGRVAAAVDYTE